MSYEEFRKRIDTLCNILVGAVPSPAGQIDQITYALMYKFMNDRDDKAASYGSKRSYFVGEYEKYNWNTLMSPSLGAHERLELYRQAIQTMAKNENIPELFRTIYQNAFLPFNSANVLTLFLKEIDHFTHSDADEIGDVYEYLLSRTGAQGDVGQFRTPRHTIKFIVEAVNPTKGDTVIDPACGTAGFLIAAYNHVKSQHDGKDERGNTNDEKRLTADELDKIHHNYRGFDIDPTMVRTAKVNMYLHGFKTPDIINHDSLSSEEYWNDHYDVILANPPFMTPKGGIQPHKKFGISANRAEVLFVDYIASHLKPTGRAGIVVPEGIIFQSGKAYKELRKNLVENYLYAVVSLPAGVFQPYSGVKTSVLLFDKELAKQRDEILFVKVENDGYSLGAQRRKITGDQFPEALEVIEKFKAGEEFASEFAHSVSRSEIAESGDYNLSGDRYKIIENAPQDWPIVRLDEICKIDWGNTSITKKSYVDNGEFLAVSAAGMDGRINHYEQEAKTPVLSAIGANCGRMFLPRERFTPIKNTMVFVCDENKVLSDYLYSVLSGTTLPRRGGGQPFISKGDMSEFKIPLPPIEIQREIVAELDGYQKIIDAAQTIVQTYKPNIKINPEWQTKSIDELVELNPQKNEIKELDESTEVSFVPMAQLSEQDDNFIEQEKKKLAEVYKGYTYFKDGDVLLAKVTPCFENGKSGIARNLTNGIGFGSSEFYVLRPKSQILPELLYLYISDGKFIKNGISHMTGTGGLQRLTKDYVLSTSAPLPPIETQREIVAELEAEQQLIDANKKLIEIYQQKIKSKIAKVWGE